MASPSGRGSRLTSRLSGFFRLGTAAADPQRRRLLKWALGAGLLAWSGHLFKGVFWPKALNTIELQTLAAYLDTFIPADETPSATALGVHNEIIATAAADYRFRRLLHKGCSWLDGQARILGAEGFAQLNDGGREQIVALAAAEAQDSLPGILFERLRREAFFHYYGHPLSWAGFPYAGPPQPKGHLDYYLPPRLSP